MKVLVIDDEAIVLKQLDKCLGTAEAPDGEHYKVTCASNYTEALDILGGKPFNFDAVITDMRMESDEKEGLAVLHELMDKSPVTIVLTAHPSIPNCVAAMREGAWDYIEKIPPDEKDPYDRLLESLAAAYRYRKANPETGRPSPDSKWIHAKLARLMDEYPGEIVAVLDRQVVAHATNYDDLTKQLEGRFLLTQPTIISIPDTTVDAIE